LIKMLSCLGFKCSQLMWVDGFIHANVQMQIFHWSMVFLIFKRFDSKFGFKSVNKFKDNMITQLSFIGNTLYTKIYWMTLLPIQRNMSDLCIGYITTNKTWISFWCLLNKEKEATYEEVWVGPMWLFGIVNYHKLSQYEHNYGRKEFDMLKLVIGTKIHHKNTTLSKTFTQNASECYG